MPPAKLSPPMHSHQDEKAGRAERAVRRDDRCEDRGLERACPLSPFMVLDYTKNDGANKPPDAKPRGQAAKPPARAKPPISGAPKRKPRPTARRLTARCRNGRMAEIEEAFRRFAAANPTPRGELQHINRRVAVDDDLAPGLVHLLDEEGIVLDQLVPRQNPSPALSRAEVQIEHLLLLRELLLGVRLPQSRDRCPGAALPRPRIPCS